MTPTPTSLVHILGPQRFRPNLAEAVRAAGIEGTIATVTAGWQEREAEDDELREHLGGRAVNLMLHSRGEEVFESDPDLARAHKERQRTLRKLQVLYRARLAHAAEAAREIAQRTDAIGGPGPESADADSRRTRDHDPLVEEETQDAVRAIRDLDARHYQRVSRVHADFESAWTPLERPEIDRHRREIAAVLAGASALALAGGHVAVLLNRLRLFGLLGMTRGLPIVAWSAGAMVLPDKVVIFHDSPPHGPGNAEVLDRGLGVCPELVPLPHARRRLRLDDPARVSLFARRFAPAACVVLETGSRLEWSGRKYTADPRTFGLSLRGTVEEIGAA